MGPLIIFCAMSVFCWYFIPILSFTSVSNPVSPLEYTESQCLFFFEALILQVFIKLRSGEQKKAQKIYTQR